MNVNYIGSFAEQNMVFNSSVGVDETISNEPFHCLSVYIPSNIAPAVIQNYANDAVRLTKTKPLVYSCDAQSYTNIMTGGLLTQMQPIFNDGANTAVIIYLIVFFCDTVTPADWSITASTIEYAPLKAAFEKLYFISYLKMLYDPSMNGQPASVPALGSLGSFNFTVSNTSVTTRVEGQVMGTIRNDTASPVTLPAGTVLSNNNYSIVVAAGATLAANETKTFGTGSLADIAVTISTSPTFAGAFPLALPLSAVNITTLASGAPLTWGAITITLTGIAATGQAAGLPTRSDEVQECRHR